MDGRARDHRKPASWRETARHGLRETLTRGWAAADRLGARARLERRFFGYDDAPEGARILNRDDETRPPATRPEFHPDDPASRALAGEFEARYPRPVRHTSGIAVLDAGLIHPDLGLHVGKAGIFAPAHCAAAVFDNPKYAAAQHLLPLLPAPRLVEDAVLFAPSWHHNYYHWMIDILPRLDLLEAAGITAPLVLPAKARRFAHETLDLLEAGPLIAPLGRGAYEVGRLILPGAMAPDLDFSAAKARFLRDRFLPRALDAAAPGPNRRLYVSRADAAIRRVANEADLLTDLSALGFAPVLPTTLSVAEQAAAFAGAEFIVAPHGAALANLAFCRPGTRVIEIFCAGHFNASYQRIAEELGLVYGFMVAPRTGQHLAVPPAPLRALIRRMEA